MRLIGPPITAVVAAGPPSGLDLRGLLPGMGAIRRRCPETGGERAAQPEYASALGVGGKARAGLEAPSETQQGQRFTVVSGAEELVGATGRPWQLGRLLGVGQRVRRCGVDSGLERGPTRPRKQCCGERGQHGRVGQHSKERN